MSLIRLIEVLKAWPTKEERLRKGLVKAQPPEDQEQPTPQPSKLSLLQRARTLKLRAMQRQRRRDLETAQRERKA